MIMIGFELKYFGDQLQPSDSIVRDFIFVDWTFVLVLSVFSSLVSSVRYCSLFVIYCFALHSSLPLSLSMSIMLEGCFGIEFTTLSTVFDPLGPSVAGPKSPRQRDTYKIREFFRRASLSAVSLYIFHAVIMNVIVRITSYVETSDGDTYMYYDPIWGYPAWIGDIIFGIAGFLYFVIWEVILHQWFTRAKGIGTTEWMMGQGANLVWNIVSSCQPCCHSGKDTIPEEEEEEDVVDVVVSTNSKKVDDDDDDVEEEEA